jgi:hypothetical protein
MAATRGYDTEAFNRLPFREKLEVLYGVSALEKRDLILSSPDGQRLLRSFAPESLFYTVKEIGLHDAAELLSLVSGEQLCSLVDLDCWKKNRLDTTAMLDWIEAILEGGSRTVGEFLNAVDLPLLVLFLKRFIRVHRTEDPEEEQPELRGPEIFELDEHYRIEFLRWDARGPVVRALLEELYERDYSYFVTVMEEVWWGMDSELEETSFQLRNARLQDRGFPDYYEALEIYRPLDESRLAERLDPLGRSRGAADEEDEWVPAERSLLVPEEARSFLSEVLGGEFDFDGQNELRQEMAYLTNRVMVAEGVDYADRDSVAAAVRLAHDTTNLALEVLSGCDRKRAGEVLSRRYLQHLFRFGWGLLLSVRREAKRVADLLGASSPGPVRDFLDTPYREALEGFLASKPRFFEGLERPGEIRYRPFGSLADLERAQAVLEDLGSLPALCRRVLRQELEQLARLRPSEADEFRLSAAVLTALAHRSLGHEPSLRPLDAQDLRQLREATVDPAERRLRPEARRRFLEDAGGGRFVEFCLARFEEEFASIAPEEPIDPRFVTCLMVRP